jgi:predicted transcriptional regulator
LQEKQTVTGTGKKKPTIRQVGDVYWNNIAYFASPENALKYVIQKEIRENWVDDLKELVKEVSKLEKMIDGLSFKSLPQIVQ